MPIINPGGVGGGDFGINFIVSVTAGATITATNGTKKLTALATEDVTTLALTAPGTWTVYATLGDEVSSSVEVYVPESYSVILWFVDVPAYWKSVGTLQNNNSDGVKGVTFNNNAVFVGGYYSYIDRYDENLSRYYVGTCAYYYQVSNGLEGHGLRALNDTVLFILGGRSGIAYYTYADAYNTEWTELTIDALTNKHCGYGAAVCTKNHVLCGGGSGRTESSSTTYGNQNSVETYDVSLTKGTADSLPASGSYGACEAGNYAVFAGRYYSSSSSSSTISDQSCAAYDDNLTKITIAAPSFSGPKLSVQFKGKAYFRSSQTTFDVYDESLTLSSIPANGPYSTGIIGNFRDTFIVFGYSTDALYALDANGTVSSMRPFDISVTGCAVASVGDTMLMTGGTDNSTTMAILATSEVYG